MGAYRKQHYIPQFYLRGWSDETQRRTAVFDRLDWRMIPFASIRHQGQRPNLYEDIELERALAFIENAAAPVVAAAIQDEMLPPNMSAEHISLLQCALIMHVRTPTNIDASR